MGDVIPIRDVRAEFDAALCTGTTMSDWQVEPRPVPEELTEGYQAEPYQDPWNSVMERLDKATMAQLMEIARGGIGEPTTDTA